MIRINVNPMGSGPPETLSKRPLHEAPWPLLALYMESLNGCSGLPEARHWNLGSGPLMALSVRSQNLAWGPL